MHQPDTTEREVVSRRRSRRSGTSIIETLFALGLLAAFVTGAGKSIMMTRQLSDKTQAHYTAINIAKNQVEQVRNLRRSDFAQIMALQENGVRVDERGIINPNGLFRRTTTITKDIRNDYLIEVVVRVDLLNQVTRQFEGEHEELQSYIAHLLM